MVLNSIRTFLASVVALTGDRANTFENCTASGLDRLESLPPMMIEEEEEEEVKEEEGSSWALVSTIVTCSATELVGS
jgi:hypothetical protein